MFNYSTMTTTLPEHWSQYFILQVITQIFPKTLITSRNSFTGVLILVFFFLSNDDRRFRPSLLSMRWRNLRFLSHGWNVRFWINFDRHANTDHTPFWAQVIYNCDIYNLYIQQLFLWSFSCFVYHRTPEHHVYALPMFLRHIIIMRRRCKSWQQQLNFQEEWALSASILKRGQHTTESDRSYLLYWWQPNPAGSHCHRLLCKRNVGENRRTLPEKCLSGAFLLLYGQLCVPSWLHVNKQMLK